MDLGGVGVGYRAELSAELLRAPSSVDFVELLCESSLATRAREREAEAISEIWPTVVHGVKLSLGSAEGIDIDHAKRLGVFARKVGARAVSEHASFVRAGGVEIGHLTATPFTREAVRVIAANAHRARRYLPDVPFLIENVAWSMRYSEDAMGEGAFHHEVLERSSVGLLLDLGNVLANAKNAGVSAVTLLESYPLERTAQVHIAGGCLEGGFYFDTHGHAVGDEVFELLELVVKRVGEVPIVLERDDHIPRLATLSRELERARAIGRSAEPIARAPRSPSTQRETEIDDASPELAQFQVALARALTSADFEGFDEVAVTRSRGILRKKRIEDAMTLLPRLRAHGERLRAIASEHVGGTPRARSHGAIVDAWAIAHLASREASMRRPARIDELVLRARFVERNGLVESRRAPFLARDVATGSRAWVWKGLGAGAPVKVFEKLTSGFDDAEGRAEV